MLFQEKTVKFGVIDMKNWGMCLMSVCIEAVAPPGDNEPPKSIKFLINDKPQISEI